MNSAEIRKVVVETLRESIYEASRDYCRWTTNRVLYDDGTERLFQVTAARRLFAAFPKDGLPNVRIERRYSDFIPTAVGRADLIAEFRDVVVFVEFKLYTNRSILLPDIARLKKVVARDTRLGFIAAPCFLKASGDDWPSRFGRDFSKEVCGMIFHPSIPRPLPQSFSHKQGWSFDSAIIFEIVPEI